MPKFEFIPEGHIYKVKGQRWVSVTQCLPDIYYSDNIEAKLRGQYGHEMCRLYLLNDLNEDTLDDILKPYLEALKLFLSHSKGMGIVGVIDFKLGAKTHLIELQIPAYIELVNNGHDREGNKLASGMHLEKPLFHPVYQYAGTPDIVLGDIPAREVHALYLQANGKYKLVSIPNVRRNLEHFLCKLDSFKWDKEHGYIK